MRPKAQVPTLNIDLDKKRLPDDQITNAPCIVVVVQYGVCVCVSCQACIDENAEMVQFLVESGSDVSRGDNEGWTPLHASASCGFIQITKWVFMITLCMLCQNVQQIGRAHV